MSVTAAARLTGVALATRAVAEMAMRVEKDFMFSRKRECAGWSEVKQKRMQRYLCQLRGYNTGTRDRRDGTTFRPRSLRKQGSTVGHTACQTASCYSEFHRHRSTSEMLLTGALRHTVLERASCCLHACLLGQAHKAPATFFRLTVHLRCNSID